MCLHRFPPQCLLCMWLETVGVCVCSGDQSGMDSLPSPCMCCDRFRQTPQHCLGTVQSGWDNGRMDSFICVSSLKQRFGVEVFSLTCSWPNRLQQEARAWTLFPLVGKKNRTWIKWWKCNSSPSICAIPQGQIRGGKVILGESILPLDICCSYPLCNGRRTM